MTISKTLFATLLMGVLCATQAMAADHFLADRHVARGLKCESCHTTMPPKAVPSSQCKSCHGDYDKLAKLTETLDVNPHDSHIENPDCGECHHGHCAPAFLCDQCHQFDGIKVP